MKKFMILVIIAFMPINAYSADFSEKNTQSNYVAEGQVFLKKRMKDPSSAKWRNVRFNRAMVDGKEFPAVCGEVNSKNSFGGYTGFQKFVSVPPAIAAIEDEVADFHNLWNKMCL